MGWFSKKDKNEDKTTAEVMESTVETVADEAAFSEDASSEAAPEAKPEKQGFFKRLAMGLSKTRNNISDSWSNLFKANEIDEDFYEELEETLVMSDMGFETTERIIDDLKARVKEQHLKEAAACKDLVVNIIRDQMAVDENAYDFEDKKTVVFVIGVNGVGKTTSIGKLAAIYKSRGKKVLLAAADTFRAAAGEQLEIWGDRIGINTVRHQEGADPSAVIYDAIQSAKAKGIDVLICDTAGRLQTKRNLMQELEKMNKVISKEYPEAERETLLVLDATTGKNAISQAKEFNEAAEVTGIVLTKLDGTAKGGIAITVTDEFNIPIKFIGVGEKLEDLQEFHPRAFAGGVISE